VIGARLAAAWHAFRAPAVRVRNQYDAGSVKRRLAGWMPGTTGPNDSTLPNLRTLRDRSRSLIRNAGYARRIVRILASEMLGTGITPKSVAPDPEYRKAVDALWKRSEPQLDADGRLDVYGLQWQAVACWLGAGEVFVRDRLRLASDGLAVPIQFQVIEPEFCPLEDARTLGGGNKIRAGIEFSPIGRRLAYHLYRQRPGDTHDLDTSQLVRVDADTVRHLYIPERPGQLRGVPQLTQALVTILDHRGANDATLYRLRLANLFLGWVESLQQDPAGGEALDPITGKAIERDASDEAAMVKLEPGILLTPPWGQTLKFSDPPKVGTEYEAFNRQYLREISAASDVPYHALTGDLSQINDRTARVILIEFRRFVEQLQWLFVIPQLCEPMRRSWFMRAIVSGALPTPRGFWDDPSAWAAAEWTAPAFAYIHPVQEVEADIKRVRAGFASRRQIIRERGYDPELIERERAEELAAADADGRVDDTDPRRTDVSGGAQSEPEAETADAGRR
jgi:lambda family phage portal protein